MGLCIDCGKKITIGSKSKRCQSCCRKGNLSSNYKHGLYSEKYKKYCIDCGEELCFNGSIRCKTCSNRKISAKRLGSGSKYYCIENCGTIVSKKGNRCPLCAMKKVAMERRSYEGKNNPNFNKHNLAGQNHWNWKDGSSIKLYPLGWTKTFKEQIRYRDYYKCQICGKPEIEQGWKLDIHHIDYNKENINPENLIDLCKSCHMKTNYNREYWKGCFKELQHVNV